MSPALWTAVEVDGHRFNVQVALDHEFVSQAIREAAKGRGPGTHEVSRGGVTIRLTRVPTLIGGKVVE